MFNKSEAIEEKEFVKILLKFSFFKSTKPLSIIFAFWFAPTITPSPLIANNPTLVVDKYSNLGWKDKINSLLNFLINNFVSILRVASFTSAKVCCSLDIESVEASMIPIVLPS